MEVKSIYLDLQKAELKKNWKKSVWKLESEAFKEPLELKIGYEDKELDEFNQKIEDIKSDLKKKDEEINKLKKYDLGLEEWLDLHLQSLLDKEKRIQDIEKNIENQNKEISQLYKVIADAKTTIETQSGTILHLQDKVKELEKKITKQPSVYSDKTFISGHESVGLTMIEIPSGEYLVISKYMLCDKNEYVENMDDIVFSKITVNDNCYIPYYQLYGGTDLDKPCATVYRDLVLIPC